MEIEILMFSSLRLRYKGNVSGDSWSTNPNLKIKRSCKLNTGDKTVKNTLVLIVKRVIT